MPVDPDHLTLIARAITAVWEMHRGDPVDFDVVVVEAVEDPTGVVVAYPTHYAPGADRFVVSLSQVRDWAERSETSVEVALVIAAAHEAMHAVQDARGDLPRDLAGHTVYQSEYLGHPVEIEAWAESLNVLKGVFPAAVIRADAGHGVMHETPGESRYGQVWDSLVFGWDVTSEMPAGVLRPK